MLIRRFPTRAFLALLLAGTFATQQLACIVVSEGGHDWGECDWEDPECECDDEDRGGRRGRDRHDRHDEDRDDHTDGGDQHNGNDDNGDSTTGDGNTNGQDPDANCDAPDPTEVCGADGQTYATPCDASRAKVPVAHPGACGPACHADTDCVVGRVCGATSGRCEPLDCSDAAPAPVCGVDIQTYASSCHARAAHIAELMAGECPPACQADTDCEVGDICTEQGYCADANCPEIAADDYSQEVCADDGFTYASSCLARAAHLTVAHEGCCI